MSPLIVIPAGWLLGNAVIVAFFYGAFANDRAARR